MNCPKCGMGVRYWDESYYPVPNFECGSTGRIDDFYQQSQGCKRIAELTEENKKLRIVIQRTFKSNFQSFDTSEELIGFMFEQLENE